MISDPWFYFLAVPAVLIMGLAKGGFGGAISIVCVPMMSLVMNPLRAAAILLPILCVMDLLVVHKYWRKWHRENLRIMLPGALAGIILGALFFGRLPEAHLRIFIGCLALVFILDFLFRRRKRGHTHPGRARGSFWSMLAGFMSFGMHGGGPPLSIYLLPQKLHPSVYVSTTAVFYASLNYAKLAPYAWLGLLEHQNLMLSLILLPVAPLGVAVGYYLHDRISILQFYFILYSALAITGVKLIYDGLTMA